MVRENRRLPIDELLKFIDTLVKSLHEPVNNFMSAEGKSKKADQLGLALSFVFTSITQQVIPHLQADPSTVVAKIMINEYGSGGEQIASTVKIDLLSSLGLDLATTNLPKTPAEFLETLQKVTIPDQAAADLLKQLVDIVNLHRILTP